MSINSIVMQIKFKAVTTDGMWVEGDLTGGDTVHVRPPFIHEFGVEWYGYEVIPETVCAGFYVKGKTIFHGDKVRHNDKEFIAVLTENAGFALIENNSSFGNILNDRLIRVEHNHRSQLWLYNVSKYLKITGNIHDPLIK